MVTLSVEISCYRMIFLLESFVIISVMSLVYIDKSFSLRYSRMNFTIGIILSVTLYVQLTRHRIVCLFLFLFFLLRFPQYIQWEYLCPCLPMNLAIKKIRSVNIIIIYYWQKNLISIFICVYQLSSSGNLLICFGSKCFDLSLLPQCVGVWDRKWCRALANHELRKKLFFRVPLFLSSSIEFYGLKLKWLDLVAYRFHQLLQSAIAHSLPMFFSSVFFMLG